MNNTVIIAAGGSGSRMKQNLPKQFLDLQGMPVLMHAIRLFHTYDPALIIIVALPANYTEYWKELCHKHQFGIKHEVVTGGKTRFHTVINGLSLVKQAGLVAIHDGVRPLVSNATLERCFNTAREKGTAIPCIPIPESIRMQNGEGNYPVDRMLYKLIQTPQVFRWEILKKAFNQEYQVEFTDDASVVEKAGFPVYLVEGNTENIKITTPEDLMIAEALMNRIRE
jgi:2-C-methyl-D-erythritol 4-phosphate cytidylyltransferase